MKVLKGAIQAWFKTLYYMLLGYCLHDIQIFLMYIFKRKFLLNKNIYVNIADFCVYDTKLKELTVCCTLNMFTV